MEVTGVSQSGFMFQLLSKSIEVQSGVLLRLLDVVRQAEVAQAKPLGNLTVRVSNNPVDQYA